MKIVEPTVTLKEFDNQYEAVAYAASICYNSTPKTGDDAVKFYNALVSSGHISCLRHMSCYYIIDWSKDTEGLGCYFTSFFECPYIEIRYDKNDVMYVATNGNFIYDCLRTEDWLTPELEKFKVSADEFNATEIGHEMMRYSFVVETQISTTREFNRQSPNNILEQSTRYITMDGESKRAIEPSIVRPHWLSKESADLFNNREFYVSKTDDDKAWDYLMACDESFDKYISLLNVGMKPEDARGVLPLDTYTKAIYTYSVNEWKHFLDLRLYGKTGNPHPNIKILAQMIKDELAKLNYTV